jgi:hypothetical protein
VASERFRSTDIRIRVSTASISIPASPNAVAVAHTTGRQASLTRRFRLVTFDSSNPVHLMESDIAKKLGKVKRHSLAGTTARLDFRPAFA